MDKIKQYYKLCGITLPQANIFSCIDEKAVNSIFGEPKLFLSQANGTYKLKETIIGGGSSNTPIQII